MTLNRTEKSVVFLRGKKTVLRPLDVNRDLVHCHRWINDPDIRQYVMSYVPMTLRQETQWFEHITASGDVILAIETLDGTFIGTMGLHGIRWVDGTATTGALIGEPEYQGKGYGTDAKMVLLEYAFHSLALRKICSSVIAYNTRSHNYSLKCGYVEEGRRVKHVFRHGAYHDQILLAVFYENWLPLWKEYAKDLKQ